LSFRIDAVRISGKLQRARMLTTLDNQQAQRRLRCLSIKRSRVCYQLAGIYATLAARSHATAMPPHRQPTVVVGHHQLTSIFAIGFISLTRLFGLFRDYYFDG